MKIKKIMIIAGCLFLAAVGLTACGTGENQDKESTKVESSAEFTGTDSQENISVVCTIFPEYDWVKEILGNQFDQADVTYLLDNGVDLHNYQPTAADITKIASCDLFVYVGGESDKWVEDALKEATNKDMQVINLMEVMGDSAKEEELKEGMQGEEDDEEDEENEEEVEYDEHVWLSVKNAKIFCERIADSLCEIDSDNAEQYKANLSNYTDKLEELDNEFHTLTASAENKTLIFGDRFPFRYLVEDYDLDYYAAFIGCSAETEASFETIAFLSKKVDELGCDTVYTIENSDDKIAQAIIQNTEEKNQEIAALDSMQSVFKKQVEDGETYLSIMQGNYDVLKNHLK